MRTTIVRPASTASIKKAARFLRIGEPVAFPTETVYGLGADATSDAAIARIFEIKNRPRFNPLIVHVQNMEAAIRIGTFNETAQRLAREFWPGPLSLVVPRTPNSQVSLLACAGLDTVAIRIPDHETARAILTAANLPIAAPSANSSGKVSPTRAIHVVDSIGDRIDLVIDSGPCGVGLESTVVDCTTAQPVILRPGGITSEAIEARIGTLSSRATAVRPASPGMLESHYAPERPLRLNVRSLERNEALLSFGTHHLIGAATEMNLSRGGNLREAAANLFAMLRDLDQPEYAGIAVTPVPETGLGRALNDRLRRAASSHHRDER